MSSTLLGRPAIGLFAELGWQTVSASEETFGATGTLRRETKGEAILVSRLRAALEQLNPKLPPEAIAAALDELSRDRSAAGLEAANREIYLLIKEGIPVSVPDNERGGQKSERVRVLDWESPAANDFLLVSPFSVTGALYTCRPDLVGFVNGLPLVVIELKARGVPARTEYSRRNGHSPGLEGEGDLGLSSPPFTQVFGNLILTRSGLAVAARVARINHGEMLRTVLCDSIPVLRDKSGWLKYRSFRFLVLAGMISHLQYAEPRDAFGTEKRDWKVAVP